ncbi:MAG: 1-hydroxycarotenoid 3,4-desaturase CrtD [Halorhodospira sp.]
MIGAGMGGLAAAIDLASAGLQVTVIERAPCPGGKLRTVQVGGAHLDAGPTVFTMREAFERLFADAGERLGDHLALHPVERLARHAWTDGSELDLFANPERSAEAIGDFAGAAEAHRYRAFCQRAAEIHATLDTTFLRAQRTNPAGLVHRVGYRHLGAMLRISPFTSLWQALGRYFKDPRLRQLYGRYATYCGSSPFLAPATLMVIAHVEAEGVWQIEGGMHRLADALAGLAQRLGVTFRYRSEVGTIRTQGGRVAGVDLTEGEHLPAEVIVSNADAAALGAGHFGAHLRRAVSGQPPRRRSQSAITWNWIAEARGFPLHHHTVFFSSDYADEFDAVFRRGEPPPEPTVYICAQDRHDQQPISGPERLLCLINAPAHGDTQPLSEMEIEQCQHRTFTLLQRCGLQLQPTEAPPVITTPAEFEQLFPATGGALYGMASHGWRASFQRPGARTRVPGLYLAGGSTHPGAGLPMAMMSGRLAAEQVLADLTSAIRSRRAAMSGGTSTP